MSLAIDSSGLIALFKGESDSERWFEFILAHARQQQLLVCDVVFAEIAPFMPDVDALLSRLDKMGIRFDSINPSTAFLAGEMYSRYRGSGGPRTSLVPDFLIGAHALRQAGGLLTSDRGYLRTYFADLKTFQPPNS